MKCIDCTTCRSYRFSSDGVPLCLNAPLIPCNPEYCMFYSETDVSFNSRLDNYVKEYFPELCQ